MKQRPIARLSRLLVMAILLGYLGYTLASWFIAWNPADAGAYYDAAHRLTTGQPLYPPVNPEAHEVYRYAPWFAIAWMPYAPASRAGDAPLVAGNVGLRRGRGLAPVAPFLMGIGRPGCPRRPDAGRDRDVRQRPAACCRHIGVGGGCRIVPRVGWRHRLDQAGAARLRAGVGWAPGVATCRRWPWPSRRSCGRPSSSST